MSKRNEDPALELLHHRTQTLKKGEPVSPPIELSSNFQLPGDPNDPAGTSQYGRSHNANWRQLERSFEVLEDAPALVFPSGMAAISAALVACCEGRDHLILPSDGYYVTRMFAKTYLARMGVAVEERPTRGFLDRPFSEDAVVLIETPSNPGLDLIDLDAATDMARTAKALTLCDNTTITPFGCSPLDFGIDVVMAADTKAPAGHSDVLVGHVATRDETLFKAMESWRRISGSIIGPFEAWLTDRGLQTLELRFERMCTNASAAYEALKDHSALGAIRFPGAADHPDHALAKRQMRRFGFLLGLEFIDAERAERFIEGCTCLIPATSFGGTHSSAERRARWGDPVADGYVRLSLGCEPTAPLVEGLRSAMDRA